MRIRVVGKIGAILSIILFCIGVVLYGFARFRDAEEGKNVNLLSLIPADCVGLLETDNLDLLANELPQTAYACKFDSACASNILPIIFNDLVSYASGNTHGIGNYMGRLMVSFHDPDVGKSAVAYFTTNLSGRKIFGELLKEKGIGFQPKSVKYRGKKVLVFPVDGNDFLSVYSGRGFVAVSYQKSLIEKVIDAENDGKSLKDDRLFCEAYHNKTANFMTLYARSASFPLLAENQASVWSEFDIHLNSEVLYLSGSMCVPSDSLPGLMDKLAAIPQVETDSVVVLTAMGSVEDCIGRKASLATRSIFDECVLNLSSESVYALMADMDAVIRNPRPLEGLLPSFVFRHLPLFRSFVFSLQLTRTGDKLSHLLVFTYKE